jgi:hypothetical protein
LPNPASTSQYWNSFQCYKDPPGDILLPYYELAIYGKVDTYPEYLLPCPHFFSTTFIKKVSWGGVQYAYNILTGS